MRLLAGIVMTLVPALASGQSMSEAAQKEKERRQKLKASGASAQVINDESLKPAKQGQPRERTPRCPALAVSLPPNPEPPKPPQLPPPRPRSPTPRPPAVKAGPPVVSEQEWRGRSLETRRRIADRQRRYDYVANLRLTPEQSFTDETGKSVLATPENLQRALAAAQAEIDAAKKELEDLQEEARRQ